MSLRLKLNAIVALLTLCFALSVLGLELRGLRDSVHEEVQAAHRVAAQLLHQTARLYSRQGLPAMLYYLQGLGRVRATDISLIDEEGQPLYQSPPSAYKAGRDAPAWFSRLIAPQASQQAIAFGQGRLVLQANASRAVLDAWDFLLPLCLWALGLLLLANGLAFAMIQRALRPLAQVVDAMDELRAGNLAATLPRLASHEAQRLGLAFNQMAQALRHQIAAEGRASSAERELSDRRELSRWIDQHIERERRLIARELHDEFGQSVTGMRALALAIAQGARGADPQTADSAELIAAEAGRLYDAMHRIIPRLTPLVLDQFGLQEALQDLLARCRQSHAELTLELSMDLGSLTLSHETSLALYRAAQEGITNALRHGQASHVRLSLQQQEGAVLLRVQDNGSGLSQPLIESHESHAAPDGHLGLRWLSERVAALGGQWRLQAASPRGAELSVYLQGVQA